jgi:hypothetical protein
MRTRFNMQTSRSSLRREVLVIAGVLVGVEAVVLVRRQGSLLVLDTVVRCRSGHLFTTWWIPGVSVNALRLGWWRLQRCPVGRHWSLVTPVSMSTLSDDQRTVILAHRSVRARSV